MNHVLFRSDPFKITGGIVFFVAVFMVDLIGAIWPLTKMFCYKPVNKPRYLNPVVPKSYLWVPMVGRAARQAAPLVILTANYIAVRMHKIFREIMYLLFHQTTTQVLPEPTVTTAPLATVIGPAVMAL